MKIEQQRIDSIEKDTDSLKRDVTKLLSIIALQSEQLSRQELIINELRDEKRAKENRSLYYTMMLMLAFMAIILFVGIPRYDTVLQLTTLATPVKAPFITTSVRVTFTIGDVVESVKAAMAGPSSTALVVMR